MLRYLLASSVMAMIVLSGCRDEPAAAVPLETWLPLAVNEVPIEVQIALSPAEQQRGLMYRKTLGENRGMLFPYTQPRQMSFWMANTPLPLDIGFFDGEGVLLEIHRMVPYDTNRIRSNSDNATFALEMNRGWFGQHGLYPGARLDTRLLGKALRLRGADPARFGLD